MLTRVSVINSHPDLDCIFVNSGIQRRAVFSQPETIDMDVIQEEVMVCRAKRNFERDC